MDTMHAHVHKTNIGINPNSNGVNHAIIIFFKRVVGRGGSKVEISGS